MSNKKVSEVCNLSVRVQAKTAYVTGTCENITEPWKEFSATGANTGHFAIVKMPESFVGKKVELDTSSGKHFTYNEFDSDRIMITLLDGYKGDKTQVYKIDSKEVLTVNYSGVELKA